jgi:hypothetical protein
MRNKERRKVKMETQSPAVTVRKSYRVTIQTKFMPNSRTVKVWHYGGKMFAPWTDELEPVDNHANAISLYLEKMGWGGNWVIGASVDGCGYVAVCEGGAN